MSRINLGQTRIILFKIKESLLVPTNKKTHWNWNHVSFAILCLRNTFDSWFCNAWDEHFCQSIMISWHSRTYMYVHVCMVLLAVTQGKRDEIAEKYIKIQKSRWHYWFFCRLFLFLTSAPIRFRLGIIYTMTVFMWWFPLWHAIHKGPTECDERKKSRYTARTQFYFPLI